MYNKNTMRRGRYSSTTDASYNKASRISNTQPSHKPELSNVSLAMVYPVSQSWCCISDGVDGFNRGTIFDELNKPFFGDKCKNGGCCR